MQIRGHKVPALSTKHIKDVTDVVSNLIGAVSGGELRGARDIVGILDRHLPKLMPHFTLMIMEDHELPDAYARTYPGEMVIQVRQSVYEGARNGNGRDRFTLAHELGHLFLHSGVTAYARQEKCQHKVYEDSEWQADTFAAEFLMPIDEARAMTTSYALMQHFNVSETAAQMRIDKIKKR